MAMGEFDVVAYALIGKKLKAKADLVDGKIPASELPSYVDDVVEYASVDQFPEEGEASKIYVALDTGNTYRWSGSEYIQIGGGSPMVETTYAALKAARDAGTLVPGMQYRITDYVAKTIASDTYISSANHQFDIIVVADDANHLNEVARAMLHEGDAYFANNNLSAWKLWYCLDNDTNRFAWANESSGKGVIYRMIDEFENDVPYDFKSIQFRKYINSSYVLSFTFQANGVDVSLNKKCNHNVIKPYTSSNKQQLNKIAFYNSGSSYSVYSNTFDVDCREMLISSYNACGNTIGNGCYNIYSGSDFKFNSIGDSCFGIYVKSNFNSNTLGSHVMNIAAGDNCARNVFDSWCQNVYLGNADGWTSVLTSTNNYYQYNHFGSSIRDVAFYSDDPQSSGGSIRQIQHVYIHDNVGHPDVHSGGMVKIVVPRDLDHVVEYYPAGSVKKEI